MTNKKTLTAARDLVDTAKNMSLEEWARASFALAVITVRDGECQSVQVQDELARYEQTCVMGTDEDVLKAEMRVAVAWWTWVRR